MEDQPTSIVLPTRPREANPNSYTSTSLITNHFLVDISKVPQKIFQWSIKTLPFIERDNRKLRSELIKKISYEIDKKIGTFCESGLVIYTSTNIENCDTYNFEADNYIFTFSKTNEITTVEIQNKSSKVPLKFLNSMIKKSFKYMNYFQIGKHPKFFRMKQDYKKIENSNYIVYSGFQTSFNYYECGLLLRVDTAIKVINEKNVLQLMNLIYGHTIQKLEARKNIRDLLIGKVVCANYGNYNTYKVAEVLFDKKLSETTAQQEINLIQYYQQKYQLKVSQDEQPLLISYIENRKKEKIEIYLVPEFMTLTGLLDDINEYQKRQVLQACNKKPDEKMKSCITFLNQLCDNSQQLNNLGIIINSTPYTFKGKKLKNPSIYFKDNKLDENRISSFQMRNDKFVRCTQNPLNWIMIYQSQGFNKQQFEELFQSNTKNYSFPVQAPFYVEIDGKNPSDQILTILRNQFSKDPLKFDLVVILVNKKYKNDYLKIKKECTLRYQVPCQWILSENLDKNAGSIIGKIIQQIASKTGGYPWKVKSYENQQEQIYDKPFLLIGASVTRDKINKKHTIAAVVSSVNNDVSQFYTQCFYQEDGSDLINNITEIVMKCCQKYYQNTGQKPERIIYIRDGINGQSNQQFVLNEMVSFLKAPSLLDNAYKPEIAICLVDRRPTQKFFVQSNNMSKNPQYGTLIDSHIVQGKDTYEFKLIPQVVSDTLGCATPTSYTFVYHDTTLSQGQMQSLIYAQCFNYSNWNGPIRVPSVVQYAIKASLLISNTIHASVKDEKLGQVLWFL